MGTLRDFLITDRTQADVNRVRYLTLLWRPGGIWTGTAAELAEWNAGLKGAYNIADRDRVTLAANYLLTKLSDAGYSVPENTIPAYMAAVSVDPPGAGVATGALFYLGDSATVRAEPIGASLFQHWKENGEIVSEDPEYTFTVDKDRDLTACFEAEWVITSSVVGAGRVDRAILGKRW